jgi:hypothetical protein
MQRLMPVVLIHYDSRGTRVLLSHPLPGPAARIGAERTQTAPRPVSRAASGPADRRHTGVADTCLVPARPRRSRGPEGGTRPYTDDGAVDRLLAGVDEFLRKG